MSAALQVPVTATAQELLVTAERLFAEHGLDGVSLRQIAVEAGSANNSAVQYHFGTKEGLVEAIFTFRLGQLLQRRALLRARLSDDDLRGRFEAHVLPLLELAESPDSYYVSFVEAIERTDSRVLAEQREALRSQDEFRVDMSRLLDHIPEPARSLRIMQAQILCLHVAAERERAVRRGGDLLPFGLFVSAVVDGFTGFMAAPASSETVRHAAANQSKKTARAKPRRIKQNGG
jgi:AcrR family transcriptional regulator